jgi:hypothetical protein
MSTVMRQGGGERKYILHNTGINTRKAAHSRLLKHISVFCAIRHLLAKEVKRKTSRERAKMQNLLSATALRHPWE